MRIILTVFFLMVVVPIAIGQNKKIKPLCNPLVIGSVPKKALSIQLENQGGFNNDYTLFYGFPIQKSAINFSNVQNVRLNYYKPIVTKQKLFVTLEAGYWYTRFNANNRTGEPFFNDMSGTALHSTTAALTFFKPLDAKHFLLMNTSVEVNGNNKSFAKMGAKNLMAGGAFIYGWKKGVQEMFGIGVARSYRFGRVAHTPVLLWNKNFNKKWGVEMLLPSRGFVRYTLKKTTDFAMLGFDLEGTQYAYNTNNIFAVNNSFVQRGEIKPRLGVDMQMSKNTRFTANVGCRINGRLDWANNYDGKELLVENNPGVNYFANVGFHILNLKGKKRK